MTSAARADLGHHDLPALLERQKAAALQDMTPSHATRDDRLRRLGAMLDRDGARFADAIAADFGTRHPIVTRLGDQLAAHGGVRHARAHLKRWMKPRRVATGLTSRPGRSYILPQPLGVVGIIAPWNYPLLLAVSPLTGALAAGNRAMLKPSELAPRFADTIKSSIADFFAEDEVAVVTGDAEVGKTFAGLPFDHLVFTGSTAVGRLVAEAAARNLTPVTLELGGKSPTIVDASADLAVAAERIAWGKLFNAGQTCLAPDYALVPRGKLESFLEALKTAVARQYPTIVQNPDYTSIISARHFRRLEGLVEDARAQGARVVALTQGEGDAAVRRLAPTALVDVSDAMEIMREEIFGPLLPIVPYDTLDEAIAYINARPRPLGLYWFGEDAVAREKVLATTISGGAVVNDTMLHCLQENLPFGGVGPSGTGQYHGEYGFRQFTKDRAVFVQSRYAGNKMLYPPFTPMKARLAKLLLRFG